MQAKLFKELSPENPTLTVHPLENIVLQDSATRAVPKQLVMNGSECVKLKEVEEDDTKPHNKMFLALQSFFCTCLLVTIDKESWFSYDDCLFVTAQMQGFIHSTHGGRLAPVRVYNEAWIDVIRRWPPQVSNDGETLAQAVQQTAGWEHVWLNDLSAPEHGQSGRVGPDLLEKLRKQIEKRDAVIRPMRSEKDKLAHQVSKTGKGRSTGYQHNNGNNNYHKNGNGGYKRGHWHSQKLVGSGCSWKTRKY